MPRLVKEGLEAAIEKSIDGTITILDLGNEIVGAYNKGNASILRIFREEFAHNQCK